MTLSKLMASTTVAALLTAAPMMASAQDTDAQLGTQAGPSTTQTDNQLPEARPDTLGEPMGDSAAAGQGELPDISTQIRDIESLAEVSNVQIINLSDVAASGQSPLDSPAGLDSQAQIGAQAGLQGDFGAGGDPAAEFQADSDLGMDDSSDATADATGSFDAGSDMGLESDTGSTGDLAAGPDTQLESDMPGDIGSSDDVTGSIGGSAQAGSDLPETGSAGDDIVTGSADLPSADDAFSEESTSAAEGSAMPDSGEFSGGDEFAGADAGDDWSQDSAIGESAGQSALSSMPSGFEEPTEQERADLRQAIEGNDALSSALEERDIDFDNVVAVEVIGEDDVIVYVDQI